MFHLITRVEFKAGSNLIVLSVLGIELGSPLEVTCVHPSLGDFNLQGGRCCEQDEAWSHLWVQLPDDLLTRSVALDELVDLSAPEFPNLQNGVAAATPEGDWNNANVLHFTTFASLQW